MFDATVACPMGFNKVIEKMRQCLFQLKPRQNQLAQLGVQLSVGEAKYGNGNATIMVTEVLKLPNECNMMQNGKCKA